LVTIFLFFFNFLILKNYFQNLKNIFKILMMWPVASTPRGQSCTVNNCHVAKTMSYQQKSGATDLFQIIFFCRDVIQTFLLQGRKLYLSHLSIYKLTIHHWSLATSG